MKKKYFFLFISIIFILLFIPVEEVFSYDKNRLYEVISRFEDGHSPSAVIIMEASKAFVDFTYNDEYVFGRCFPPGSIAKVWSALILLENREKLNFNNSPAKCSGKFYVNKSMITSGDIKTYNLPYDLNLDKNYFRCSLRKGHGIIDLRKALSQSCNVYFLTKVSRNPNVFFKLLTEKFYLNRNTGCRIKGVIEAIPPSHNNISKFQAIASSIGEGGYIRVSPAKVAQIFASILSNTALLRPHNSNNKKMYFYNNLNISHQNRDLVKISLSRALLQGTLRKLKIKNSKVELIAGKTGTGTHFRKKYATHGWNVIYYRYNFKNYILVTFVFRGSGSKEALLLSREILDAF